MGSLFFYFVYVADLMVLLHLWLTFRKQLFTNKVFLPLFLYCIANSLANTANELLPSFYRYIGSTFTVIEFLLFCRILSCFIHSTSFKRIIQYSNWLFAIFVVATYFVEGQGLVDSVPIAIESILLFIFSFKFFFQEMNDLETGFLYEKHQFWIISGILIYLGGSFFFLLFANHIEKRDLIQFWTLVYVFYIIKNLFWLFSVKIYNKVQKRGGISRNPDHNYELS